MMKQRRSVRLRDYDYRHSGAYFVTICVHPHLWRRELFGCITETKLRPNRFGRIVAAAWNDLPNHHATASLDAWVVMPNHFHAILVLTNDVQKEWQTARFAAPQADALGTIAGAFKSAVSREIGRVRAAKTAVWQRGFYEHIIRDEKALVAIRRYIIENPQRWHCDELNAALIGDDKPCPYSDARWQPEIPRAL